MHNKFKRHHWLAAASTIVFTLVGLAASPVLAKGTAPAQPAPAPAEGTQKPAAGDPSLGEIMVTATRVNRSDYSAPTPTVVIGAPKLEEMGTTNIATYLNTVPVFKPDT